MTMISNKWLQYAHADLDAAERLFSTQRPTQWTYLLVLWHCHQAVEKGLEMVIVKQGKDLLRIHDLPRLMELTAVPISDEDERFVNVLNKFYLRSRYPDLIGRPLPRISKTATFTLLNSTRTFILWLTRQ